MLKYCRSAFCKDHLRSKTTLKFRPPYYCCFVLVSASVSEASPCQFQGDPVTEVNFNSLYCVKVIQLGIQHYQSVPCRHLGKRISLRHSDEASSALWCASPWDLDMTAPRSRFHVQSDIPVCEKSHTDI